jgi:hypothetical protein
MPIERQSHITGPRDTGGQAHALACGRRRHWIKKPGPVPFCDGLSAPEPSGYVKFRLALVRAACATPCSAASAIASYRCFEMIGNLRSPRDSNSLSGSQRLHFIVLIQFPLLNGSNPPDPDVSFGAKRCDFPGEIDPHSNTGGKLGMRSRDPRTDGATLFPG